MTRRKKQNHKGRNLRIERLNQRIVLDSAGFIEPVFYEPTPYLSEADTPEGFIPVPDCDQCVVGLETFEDGSLDFGIEIPEGEIISPDFETGTAKLTDSVDGDDGVIDGTGQTGDGGWSYFSFGNTLTVNFPTIVQSAGLVWTDGPPSVTNVVFEAFDQDGNSLGTVDAGDIADDSIMGTTPEDRFFGVSYGDGMTTGVTSIVITNVGGSGIEIDHIQFANCSACCDIDLELTKDVDVTSAQEGDTVTWTVSVTNNPETASADATGVSVKDVIPDGLTVTGVSIANGSFNLDTGVWTLANPIAPGDVETITFTTTVDGGLAGGTTIVNVAEVLTADQNDVDSTPGNDDGTQSEDDEDNAQITVGSVIDLELEKTVDSSVVQAGDIVNWQVTLTNNAENANTDATGVIVEDILPPGLTLLSAVPSGSGIFFNNEWTIAEPISPGEILTLDLETVVQSGFGGTTIVNVAQVAAADQVDVDSTPGNDDGTQSEDDEDNAQVTVELSERLTLSGFSYVDVNDDGIFQEVELPLMGVAVQLTGTDDAGNEVNLSTFTNVDGLYKFNDLLPGTYTVQQVQPIQFVDGQDTLGNLGGDDSVNDTFTVTLNDNAEAYNFGELGLRPEYVGKRLYLTSTPYDEWEFIDVREFSIWHSFNVEQASFLDINASIIDGELVFTIFNEEMEVVAQRGAGVLFSDLDLILLDESGQYYLEISGEGEAETLALEITAPEITQDGNKVIAVATPGDDDVVVTLGDETHILNFSGLEFTFDASEVNEFHIGSSGGQDTITVHGTSLKDTGHVLESRGQFDSSAYSVDTYTFDNTTFVSGGGDDYVQIFGSNDNDRLAALPQDSTLTTPDNVIHILGVDRVDSYGRGGYDYASAYGTHGDDLYYARDEYALMQGEGLMNYTKGFERVDAFGRGGTDIAQLFDSVADDEFVSMPTFAYLIGINRTSYTKGFERVDAISTIGGNDRAVFIDDANEFDSFVSRLDYAYMTNGSYLNYANNFTTIRATSSGGTDTAQILDLKTGDEFHAHDDIAALLGASRDDEAKGFDLVMVAAEAGETPTAVISDVDYILSENVNWI